MKQVDFDIDTLRKELPPILTRATASEATGGAYSPGTLANFDSTGHGPKRATLGGKAVYMRDDFLTWLQGRLASPATGKVGRHVADLSRLRPNLLGRRGL